MKGSSTETANPPGTYLVYGLSAGVNWEISGTHGTPTTRGMKIDGTVSYQFRNHFLGNGYANTAQNEPVFILNNETTSFTLDPTTATTKQVADVLATFLNIGGSKRFSRAV